MMIVAGALLTAAAGPLSKFEERSPKLEYETARALGDVERCLIDLPGLTAPLTYRQPDRPGHVSIVWTTPTGVSSGRIDLKMAGDSRTLVKAWIDGPAISACAPR